MKKILISIAALIALGVSVLFAVLALVGRDGPVPDVSDLVAERIEISSESNAYTLFIAATNEFHSPDDLGFVTDYLAGKSVDAERIADILRRNSQCLALISRGTVYTRCIAPEVTGFDTLLPHLGVWLNMGKILAVQGHYSRVAGQYTEATETCITLLRFADLIQKDSESIIYYLVGLAIMDMGLVQAQALARVDQMPVSELNRLSVALAELGPFSPGLARAIKQEYNVVSKVIDKLKMGDFDTNELGFAEDGLLSSFLSGRRIPQYLLQTNNTKRDFSNYYRAMIANSSLVHADMTRVDDHAVSGFDGGMLKRLVRPNAVGRILYALVVPAMDSLLEKRCRAEGNLQATRLIVACHQ